jgi:ElaB/YqjD/DUF883 family membrane-anchored ribosome-binding protein
MQSSKERMEGGHKPHTAGTKPAEPTATGVVETVKDKMHDVTTGVSDLVTKTKDTAQEWASSAADAAGHAKDRAVEMASTAAHKIGDAGEDLKALIRRYPIQTLLIGLGVGVILGQVLRRTGSAQS